MSNLITGELESAEHAIGSTVAGKEGVDNVWGKVVTERAELVEAVDEDRRER